MPHALRKLLLAGLLVLLIRPAAYGEDARVLPPERFNGYTLHYLISWNGIPAARADARLASDPTAHHLALRSWTLPLLRLLWPAESEVRSTVHSDLTPLSFFIFRRERWKEQSASITFNRQAEEVHIVRVKPSGTVKEKTRPLDDLLDPLSLLYRLRGQPTTMGNQYEASVVVNDDVYRITVEVVDHGTMRLAGRRVPVVCVTPTASKLEDDGSEEPLRKVESVRIWVTDDALRLPVELSARAFIGRVTMALRGMDPALEQLYAQLESQVVVADTHAPPAGSGKGEG